MPLVYADTSALFAFFHPRDEFTEVVTAAATKASPDFVYWSFLRYELRHNLRQARTDSDGTAAWNALRASERTRARLRWQAELKCDSILEAAAALHPWSRRVTTVLLRYCYGIAPMGIAMPMGAIP